MATKKTETKKATVPKTGETVKSKKEEVLQDKNEAPKVRFNTLMIQEQGAKYKTLFTEKYKNRSKWEKPDMREIYSVIPGTVIKIYVEEGQKVKEGEVMMILEAMKMKNKITFPMDGVVKKINVKEAQKIPKGYLMIELK